MNDDIETLRKEIIDPEDGSVDPEANVALDRLEAEVERLRVFGEAKQNLIDRYQAEIERLVGERGSLRAEVERLRGSIQGSPVTRLAENERLRLEVDLLKQAHPLPSLLAENERLRETLATEREGREMANKASIDAQNLVQAENERLRQRLNSDERVTARNEELSGLMEENERLRDPEYEAHAEFLEERVGKLSEENERLRAHQERTKVLKKKAEAEVERLVGVRGSLRAENERLREDGIAGRDTAYRRRDAVQAENERLRKENQELRDWSEGDWWAEVERLRDALKAMLTASPQSYDWYQNMARGVLAGEKVP
jgi:chromosome segregation ATPase